MKHTTEHELAGKTVTLAVKGPSIIPRGETFVVEDWADRVIGGSWMSTRNVAAMGYAMRILPAGLPMNDEVVYGKVDGLGHIVHVSELGSVVS